MAAALSDLRSTRNSRGLRDLGDKALRGWPQSLKAKNPSVEKREARRRPGALALPRAAITQSPSTHPGLWCQRDERRRWAACSTRAEASRTHAAPVTEPSWSPAARLCRHGEDSRVPPDAGRIGADVDVPGLSARKVAGSVAASDELSACSAPRGSRHVHSWRVSRRFQTRRIVTNWLPHGSALRLSRDVW